VRLTTSLQVGEKYFGCVVCRFHVTADTGSAPCQKPASINLQKWFLSPTGRLNLGFIIEGNLPLCSSHIPLGVLNWAASTANKHFSSTVAGEKEDFCKGSLSLPIFLLCYCFAYSLYFIFVCSFLSKIQKISSFYSWYFVTFTFSSLCCSLSMS
jgi:hypothetical protein